MNEPPDVRNGLRMRLWSLVTPASATVVGIAVLFALVLSPVLWSGFAGNDVYRAQYVAYSSWAHVSFAGALHRVTTHERGGGATWPLRALPIVVWFAGPSLAMAKAIGFALIVVDAITFAAIVRLLARSNAVALVAAIAFVVSLELHSSGDPILGGTIVTPWNAELVLGAILVFTFAGSRPASRAWAVAAAASSAIAVAAAPVAVLLAPLWGAVALAARGRGLRLRAFVCASAVAAVAVANIAGLDPVTGRPSFLGFMRGGLLDALSVVPMIHRGTGGIVVPLFGDFFHDDRFTAIPDIDTVGWGIAGVCAVGIYALLRRSVAMPKAADAWEQPPLTVAGIGLWIGAAFLAQPWSDSAATIGGSSPQGYLETFGFAMVAAAAAVRISRCSITAEQRSAYAIATALSVFWILYGNIRVAHAAVDTTRRLDLGRVTIADAARAGVFRSLPAGTTLAASARDYPFRFDGSSDDAGILLSRYAGRRYVAVSLDALGRSPGASGTWAVRSSGGDTPKVTLAKLAAGTTVVASQALVFRTYADADARAVASGDAATADPGLVRSVVFTGERSAIEQIRRTCGPVSIAELGTADVPRVAWGAGFEPATTLEAQPFVIAAHLSAGVARTWRFGGRRAVLNVRPGHCRSAFVRLKLGFYTAAPAIVTASDAEGSVPLATSEAGAVLTLDVPVRSDRTTSILLRTDGPAALDLAFLPRTERRRSPEYRMIVDMVSPPVASDARAEQ